MTVAPDVTEVRPAHAGPAYDTSAVEARWQEAWREADAFAAPPASDPREPAYVFAGCPFTSGDAHMGHIRSYTIADAYARFCRARGLGVLFSLGFDSFGLPAELEAVRRGVSPRAWVEECCVRMRGQFERLGYSCDWARTFVSSEPGHYRWTQWLFLAMLERDLVYRQTAQVSWCESCQTVLAALQSEGGRCWRCHGEVSFVNRPQWFMRVTAYTEQNERGLEALAGWSKAALGAQRAWLGRVEGIEVDATTFDNRTLTVFTPHADALEQAAFVAISPTHPDIDDWASEPEIKERLDRVRQSGWRRDDRDSDQAAVVETGVQAHVPGVPNLLPVVISPAVDARFGPTVVLGMPELDRTDAGIAERLTAPPGLPFKVAVAGGEPRPAVRHRARDFPISRQRAWGAPIPLIHCDVCGAVPIPFDDLPVELPEGLEVTGAGNALEQHGGFKACKCPSCGADATRETDTIDCHVDGMWMWMPICVPPEDRETSMFDHPDYERWLPARQIVWGADAAGYMYDQRLIGRLLQDFEMLPRLDDGEPFTNALMHEMVRLDGRKMSKHLGNVVDPNELVSTVGADTVRLAVLYAASPGKSFDWNEQPVRYCRGFLDRLWSYGEERLRDWRLPESGAIDAEGDRLRRLLAKWCRVAVSKIGEDLEQLQMHRAARNAMLLLTRIEDFEQRAIAARGELDQRDREAVALGLHLLVQALAPLTPHIAEELWALAGHDTLVSLEPWPQQS
jgi:leucyl-tRNA synthetase